MKTRSRAIYDYLRDANVLHGNKDAIYQAKLEYRKRYKRDWKKRARPIKEIRFTVTLKEFERIKAKAIEAGIRHTTYARAVALESIGCPQLNRDALLQALQLVSMASIAVEQGRPSQEALVLLRESEELLITYLKI